MKKKFVTSFAAGFCLLLMVGIAHAATLTTTWVGDITYIDENNMLANSIWDVDDKISFSAIYEDVNNYITRYRDGANEIAELGAGDDSILAQVPNNTTYWNWSHDAAPLVDERTQSFMSMFPDGTTTNMSYVTERITPERLEGFFYSDGVYIWNWNTKGGIYIYENDQYVGYPVMWANSSVTTTSSAVPVPGAVWLLGAGLVGLAGLRKR